LFHGVFNFKIELPIGKLKEYNLDENAVWRLTMNELTNVAIIAAKEAGTYLRVNFEKAIDQVKKKADHSLATNLDQEAEEMIVKRIRSHFPAHAILGEERGLEGQLGAANEYLWIIDPLDGTHNYIRGIGIFGVSVGLFYKEHFISGVIYLPLTDELYVGERGTGAYKNEQKITVSKTKSLADSTISFDSDIKRNPDLKLSLFKEISQAVFNVRMLGSTVRILSYLAEGKLDASIELTDSAWDFAAGACILQAAGGTITDLQGNPITYQTKGYLASNGLLHQDLQALLSK